MPNFFRKRRDELGFTQRNIAESFKPAITPAAVSAWENDEAVPQFDGQTLARVYQCTVMEALTGMDEIRKAQMRAEARAGVTS